jgi:hypothetical protein
MRSVASWSVVWAGLCLLWLAYVGVFARTENILGAIAAAVAATAFEVVRRTGLIDIGSIAAIKRMWRVPLDTVFQFWVITAALLRGRPHGRFATVEAPPGTRVVGAWVDTISPNDYVVDVHGREALRRELVPSHSSDRIL